MSFSPFVFDYGLPRWPRRLPEQSFGLTLSPEDLLSARASPISPIVPRYPLWWPEDTRSSIKLEKDKWQISIDVQHFAPNEITVKTVNGFIVVEGKHEEKQDEHGFISRQFVRRFKIPEDTDPDTIESRLSSDGVLTVLATRKDTLKAERNVPIMHTGPVQKEVKDDSIKEQNVEK
ncbi:unnamed protein product [Euphydryas editha]|uniref:SHSP domain-containing protein n=1 Tax=Euphydryas editha TaxID=104508 RepID=A0AAU9UM72_EUPED|nr:unnamed protein product [Euphydryas editha]